MRVKNNTEEDKAAREKMHRHYNYKYDMNTWQRIKMNHTVFSVYFVPLRMRIK